MSNFSEHEGIKVTTADEVMEAVKQEPKEAEGTVEEAKAEADEKDYYVKFSKPYKFDESTYEGIDLSGLEDLSARDMIKTQREMERSGSISVLPEMSLEYACIFAAKATQLPVEFFQELPPRDAIKIKNRVTSFFYGAE